MKKTAIVFLLFVWCICPLSLFSQEKPQYKISEENKNVVISAQLPHHSEMVIYFSDINYWKGKDEIQNQFLLAADQYKQLKNSYESELSQKKLYIKIPVPEDLLSINISEKQAAEEEMIYKNQEYLSLKTTIDTILILQDIKTGKFKKKSEEEIISSVQYLFSIPNMEDIIALSEDKNMLDKISFEIDSVINAYQNKWKNTSERRLSVDIDYENEEIDVVRPASFIRNVNSYVGFGVEVLGNKFPVVMDVGFAYITDKNAKESGFIALQLGGFYLYNLEDYRKSTVYASLGTEFGLGNTETGSLRPLYSFGFSYFIGTQRNQNKLNDPINIPNMFRMTLTMPLISNLNIGLDMMSNFKISQKAINNNESFGVIGIFFKYYL